MPKTAERNEEEVLKQVEDLLSEVPGSLADLYRDGGGYRVSVIFLPDIASPNEAYVAITTSGESPAKIDALTLPADKGWDAFNHPTQFSEKLLQFLGGKAPNDPKTEKETKKVAAKEE